MDTLATTTSAFVTDRARWRAVVDRDPRASTAFVYAVRSTGVYCRPGCASRLPQRENATFFADASAAQRAGFRPCKRCRPNGAPPLSAFAERACAYLDARQEQRVTLGELAAHLGMSPAHVQRSFKRALGVSPREYQAARRLGRFKTAVRNGASVTSALYDAGFGSSSRLYAQAQRELGMQPAAFARGGRGQRIRYAIADSALGAILIAATPRGLCRVAIGGDGARLEAELRREFPTAEITRDDAGLRQMTRAVLRCARGEDATALLPLDIRATAFQQRVYGALRAIPRGQTRTYAELAAQLGQPRAARAVGRACATNPLALVIPCHRVLPAAGGLGGYAWGVARKRALLDRERG